MKDKIIEYVVWGGIGFSVIAIVFIGIWAAIANIRLVAREMLRMDKLNTFGKWWRGQLDESLIAQMPADVVEEMQAEERSKIERWAMQIMKYSTVELRESERDKLVKNAGMPSVRIKKLLHAECKKWAK